MGPNYNNSFESSVNDDHSTRSSRYECKNALFPPSQPTSSVGGTSIQEQSTAMQISRKSGFTNRLHELSAKIAGPVNGFANKLGCEAFMPTSLDKECDKASRILTSFCDGTPLTTPSPNESLSRRKAIVRIPRQVIKSAAGLAIFTAFRSGAQFSWGSGSGVVVARRTDGSWSPPSAFAVNTLSVGFMLSMDIYDCVCVLRSPEAVAAFTKPRVSFGGEVAVTAGPVGTGVYIDSAVNSDGIDEPIWSYVKSRGFSISQIVILACSILVIFASTLFLIPKSAILSRIGAALALSCLQYSFYTSLLESSLPQAQITGISLFSWGLYANGAEQVLLSRYDADDVPMAKERHSDRRLSTVTRLLRAMGMYFSLRRVGLRGEISMKKRVPSNSILFVTTKIVECVGCYLILDAILLAPRPEGHLITREKQSLFNLSSLTCEDLIFRISSSLGNWVIGYVSVRLAHGFVAAVSVLLGLCKPEDWPHLNGPISSWSTIRTFWGTFWHQLFRKALTGWGDFIPDRVLRLRRGTLLSRYSRLILTFFTSALMHRCLHYFYRLEAGEWYEIETFFLLQPLAIMFEDAAQAATAHVPLSRPLRWIVGFIWLCAFFTWVTPTFLYPTIRVPDPGQLLPFSVVGNLMKY
ncbi:uncharacterized protein BKA55DRAFT_610726 [Fusarium redolens]|uniref:Wax synthase domain-containing protein n=1 Tax=Fusarium redolens TaxID=48865 RepID=A0A9P9HKU2_FUSRE|nr:uncharacterized protein BKA55DRAFT_610726 [Fusarium redolens]KAH7259548.1 hypothetical protein BKA55DRAFT_610726 [Fusarium redolens]